MSAALEPTQQPIVADTLRRSPFMQAELGSWIWDFSRGQFAIEARWCAMLSVDPCPGRDHLLRWSRNIHPDDLFEFQRRLEDLRTGQNDAFECEYRVLTRDSRWLWVLHRGQALEYDPNGKPLRACGVCIEIDLHKQAEVVQQENEARLATALWGARAAFWQWQVATQRMQMSPLWFAMTGYSREQWEGQSDPWMSRVHPEDQELVRLQMLEHLQSDQAGIDLEYRICTGNGRWKWMLTRGRAVAWDFDGQVTMAIGISLDIQARKEAEQRTARLQQETLQNLTSASADWLALFDRERRCLFLNRALRGITPAQAVGRSIDEFAPAQERERVRSALEQVMASGETATLEVLSGETAGHGLRAFAWRARAVRTDTGVSGAVISVNEVTEKKRLEGEVVGLADREQHRIGADLHDGLGQELTGIALMLRGIVTQLGTSNASLTADVEQVIALVNGSIESTRTLARGLSPLGRGGLVTALHALAQAGLERFGIEVQFTDRAGALAQQLGDAAASHLYRIAQEALTNVARHSRAKSSRISLASAREGTALELSVTDDGKGFEPEAAGESGGLGLSLMRHRAQLLRGELRIDSAPGGVRISCVVPIQ